MFFNLKKVSNIIYSKQYFKLYAIKLCDYSKFNNHFTWVNPMLSLSSDIGFKPYNEYSWAYALGDVKLPGNSTSSHVLETCVLP